MTATAFSFATAADLGGQINYLRFCERAALTPVPEGYGFLHFEDAAGHHWTAVTTDVEYLRGLVGTSARLHAGLKVNSAKFQLSRAGWPDEWIAGEDG